MSHCKYFLLVVLFLEGIFAIAIPEDPVAVEGLAKRQKATNDFPECQSGGYPNAKTKVAIRVGEPNFQYTVCGYTNSQWKISVAGEYRNDATARRGYAYLYTVVDTGIASYRTTPNGNILDIDIQNGQRDLFYFRILTPSSVSAYKNLGVGQLNSTALLVDGPSRSARY